VFSWSTQLIQQQRAEVSTFLALYSALQYSVSSSYRGETTGARAARENTETADEQQSVAQSPMVSISFTSFYGHIDSVVSRYMIIFILRSRYHGWYLARASNSAHDCIVSPPSSQADGRLWSIAWKPRYTRLLLY